MLQANLALKVGGTNHATETHNYQSVLRLITKISSSDFENCHTPKRQIIMMKKIILISTLIILPLFFAKDLAAQTAQQIAFINSNELLEAMPEKVKASNQLIDLNNKYKEEMKVMQNDYNKKYSDFISYQTSMAENIRLRRMQELYELERQINDFMKVAQEDIQNQEKALIEPLRQRLKDAIYQVGIENGFVCIYDLANPSIAFVTPDATNATLLVKQKLGIR